MAKGQAALEYLAIVGIQLLVLSLVWLYFNTNYQTSLKELDAQKARDTVNKIADTAQVVNLQGPPAKQTVVVDFPADVAMVNVTGHEVLIRLSGNRDAYTYSPVLLNGSIKAYAGTAYIKIEAKGGFVQING